MARNPRSYLPDQLANPSNPSAQINQKRIQDFLLLFILNGEEKLKIQFSIPFFETAQF
jgi:hypothetical protein